MTRNKHLRLWIAFYIFVSFAVAQSHHFQDFASICAQRTKHAYHAYHTTANKTDYHGSKPQLVGADGVFRENMKLSEAWGITVAYCYETCDSIRDQFQFANFATSIFNWLLPWVILIAQLPYETSGPFNNLLSVLLAVGSPAFVTYGLVITLANRFRVAESFQNLCSFARDTKLSSIYPRLLDRLDAARYLLSEGQQSPMRAYDENGWLSNLLFREDNYIWWGDVKKDLRNTRRKPTLSLIIQLLYAFVAWLFTVIAAFDKLGNVVTGLSISSSSIWAWMVPVVIGWVAVGTQIRSCSIADALASHADRAKTAEDDHDDGKSTVTGLQTGITARSGINSPMLVSETAERIVQARRRSEDVEMQAIYFVRSGATPTNRDRLSAEAFSDTLNDDGEQDRVNLSAPLFTNRMPSRWSFSLAGDEAKEGPIYNYARVLTFSHFAATVERGFLTGMVKIHRGQFADPNNLSRFVGYNTPLSAYPEWHEIDPKVWRGILVASIIGLFVQWGTSGPSIMLDYLTPVAGLGCRSLSHLIYASAATLSFLFLQIASFLSHTLMLRYQRDPSKVPGGAALFFFIVLRLLGVLIAAGNALWILVASSLELSGVYDSCWCNSDFLSYGYKGWILLFRSSSQLGGSASGYWVGAVVFTSVVCFLASGFIWLGCRRCNQRYE